MDDCEKDIHDTFEYIDQQHANKEMMLECKVCGQILGSYEVTIN